MSLVAAVMSASWDIEWLVLRWAWMMSGTLMKSVELTYGQRRLGAPSVQPLTPSVTFITLLKNSFISFGLCRSSLLCELFS